MDNFKVIRKKRDKCTSNKQSSNDTENKSLLKSLCINIDNIRNTFGTNSGLVIREFNLGFNCNTPMAIIYLEGLADKKIIQHLTFELTVNLRQPSTEQSHSEPLDLFEQIKKMPLSAVDMQEVDDFETLCNQILFGNTILMVDGYAKSLMFESNEAKGREVQEPSTQTVVRGPKDGFTEKIIINTALIRQLIKDTNLTIEKRIMGRVTKTNVSVMYIKGIANENIVKEVNDRLNTIDIDGILESSYIEELVRDGAYSPFPTMQSTERPDAVAAGLLEGRIAILVDRTPFVLLVPAIFIQFFQISEDYYQNFYISTLIRLLRYMAFFISLLTPSLYIAITTFHQEMLPTPLLVSIAAQREGVPFPAFVEALLMEVTFEILREAGIRMPRQIGPTISIVGALVLGQASVEAGVISSVMVIIVSITAISSFISPNYNMSFSARMLRFFFMILAASFGLFGILIGLLIMLIHMCSLRSFGVPYMSNLASFTPNDIQDSFLRFPIWNKPLRPRLISRGNIIRQNISSKKKSSRTNV